MPSALVTGGAGYVGSHMVAQLAAAGWAVTTLDDLSAGHRDAVLAGDFVPGSVESPEDLRRAFRGRRFDVVFHFAGAPACVPASVSDPRAHYGAGLRGTVGLLDAAVEAGVPRFVFSSSCAVYGAQEGVLREDAPLRPTSPYGAVKAAAERAVADYAAAYGLRAVALRYFNVVGAAYGLRERHAPETHLVPLVLREAARVLDGGPPEETALVVNGGDLGTPDGTAVRDYVHVRDLCEAHALAAERLLRTGPPFEALNLGAGRGYSVLDVLRVAREVTGAPVLSRPGAPRPGDPPALVACPRRAAEVLGWTARRPDLRDAVASAWAASG